MPFLHLLVLGDTFCAWLNAKLDKVCTFKGAKQWHSCFSETICTPLLVFMDQLAVLFFSVSPQVHW